MLLRDDIKYMLFIRYMQDLISICSVVLSSSGCGWKEGRQRWLFAKKPGTTAHNCGQSSYVTPQTFIVPEEQFVSVK